MKKFTIFFYFILLVSCFSQSYSQSEPYASFENDKKVKAEYFKRLRTSANNTFSRCIDACGCNAPGHSHDANVQDICTLNTAHAQCVCKCGEQFKGTTKDIERQENDWNIMALKRQKDYESSRILEGNKKLAEKESKNEEGERIAEIQSDNQIKNFENEQKVLLQEQNFQQMQNELTTAQTIATNAYKNAIASGQKQSGAVIAGTLAGAQQISDPESQLIYTGVGLSLSLLSHLGEKKQERLDAEKKAENEALLIDAKYTFITEAFEINKYQSSELYANERYCQVFITPTDMTPLTQKIYFFPLLGVPKYSDDTFPLKTDINSKVIKSIDPLLLKNMSVFVLYPITNNKKFQEEFIKKMGSAHLLQLNPSIINFIKPPFTKSNAKKDKEDFWEEKTKPKNKSNVQVKKDTKKDNDFWNN